MRRGFPLPRRWTACGWPSAEQPARFWSAQPEEVTEPERELARTAKTVKHPGPATCVRVPRDPSAHLDSGRRAA
jgi:hypothetical protein